MFTQIAGEIITIAANSHINLLSSPKSSGEELIDEGVTFESIVL